MNQVIGQCPICGDNLNVVQLHCRSCDTTLSGQFSLGRLFHLSPAQLQFVETFVRCEGKITRVEQEIGLSYPAVRARLNDVIRALGYEVGDSGTEDLLDEEERREILRRISEGELSADEGIEMLRGA